MLFKKGVKFKSAISLLVVLIAFSITFINLYLSINALRGTLTENYLESNAQYAKKLSENTGELLDNMQHNLGTLAKIMGEGQFSQANLDGWHAANSNYYNSLFTTDSNGIVQLMSPLVVSNNKGGVQPGTQINTELMRQALKNKQPFISDPYSAQTGNLVVLVSFPIFDPTGSYQGVIDGTIHLQSDNSLKRILNSHEFLNESFVLVIDRSGRIIYHPDSNRLNKMLDNSITEQIAFEEKRTANIINYMGINYFSGYSYVEQTGWSIITLTPTSVLDAPLAALKQKIIVQSLPLYLLFLILTWIFTNHLAKPLNKLARLAEKATKPVNESNEYSHDLDLDLEMKSNIYEVRQLYTHLRNHYQILNHLIQRDGLTGLLNRRSFQLEIKRLYHQQIPFSLILIDIDSFKKVNDEYGHLVGDDVIRFLASIMNKVSRQEDMNYRYGGEEFAILLKYKGVKEAYKLAERLRETVANEISPTGKSITISLGIASLNSNDECLEDVINRADIALYHSKSEGKNRTTFLA